MSEEFPVIQYSFFLGGKDQIVVRGNTVDEVVAVLRELAEPAGEGMEAPLSDVLGYQVLIQAAHAVVVPQPKQQAAPARQESQPARQAQNGSNGSPGQTCPHGQMTWREGTSGKGPWKGWFCPGPRGQQCAPKFVNG